MQQHDLDNAFHTKKRRGPRQIGWILYTVRGNSSVRTVSHEHGQRTSVMAETVTAPHQVEARGRKTKSSLDCCIVILLL